MKMGNMNWVLGCIRGRMRNDRFYRVTNSTLRP